MGSEGSTSDSPSLPGTTGPVGSGSGPVTSSTSMNVDSGGSSTGELSCPGDPGCSRLLDVLIVVDNSGTMAEEQLALGRAIPTLVDQLRTAITPGGQPLNLDVNVMVTTTDMGNPLCQAFQPPGYSPAAGHPISTSCTERLDDFTDLTGSLMLPEVCTSVCPQGVAPQGDFVSFGPLGSNVPEVPEIDIDGDGSLDSPEAQALACIVPQGINGCGYESPLETMLQAINTEAAWNNGPDPFTRDDADLAILVISDEADCSLAPPDGFQVLSDPAYQNIDPDTGLPGASSAVCWNAGVECDGPDGMGMYSSCTSSDNESFHPVERYTQYLEFLREERGKKVFMVELVGVPPVLAHEPAPPHTPISGGVEDLIYRDWIDFPYPNGDILPDEWNMGITAVHKQFEFGIGPGCTGQDARGEFYSQAIPPVRMLEVCQSLDVDDTPSGTRCCVESTCDHSYDPAITCLSGMVTAVYSE